MMLPIVPWRYQAPFTRQREPEADMPGGEMLPASGIDNTTTNTQEKTKLTTQHQSTAPTNKRHEKQEESTTNGTESGTRRKSSGENEAAPGNGAVPSNAAAMRKIKNYHRQRSGLFPSQPRETRVTSQPQVQGVGLSSSSTTSSTRACASCCPIDRARVLVACCICGLWCVRCPVCGQVLFGDEFLVLSLMCSGESLRTSRGNTFCTMLMLKPINTGPYVAYTFRSNVMYGKYVACILH